jgi:hypothetical protein
VSSKSVHTEVYSIQHYLIIFNSDLVQVGGFHRVLHFPISIRRDWRYQSGNQNPYIEEKQTTQWPKEKVQKDKQRWTKHTYKTKDRVTGTLLKFGGELRCSTSDTRRVNVVTNPVISHGRYDITDILLKVALNYNPNPLWYLQILLRNLFYNYFSLSQILLFALEISFFFNFCSLQLMSMANQCKLISLYDTFFS